MCGPFGRGVGGACGGRAGRAGALGGLAGRGLAQTAALLNAEGYGETGRGMLVQVRRFHIRRVPAKGEQLTLRVDLVARLAPLSLMTGRVSSGSETLAEGELKF